MKKFTVISLTALTMLLGGGTVRTFASTHNSVLQQQEQKVKHVKSTSEGKKIIKLVDKYSKQYKVDKKLIHAIILAESGYNSRAVSSDGAVGLMQVLPRYAKKKGYNNVMCIDQNIHYGTKHIAGLLAKYKGNERLALAAYNCGGGYVDRFHGSVPPASRKYVNKVLSYKKIGV